MRSGTILLDAIDTSISPFKDVYDDLDRGAICQMY